MKTIILVALLAGAGCSKKASDCDVTIGKGMDGIAATLQTRAPNPQMRETMMNALEKRKGVLIQHCNQDKWSPEVLSCLAAAASPKDMQPCEEKLTEEQRSKLRADLRQLTKDRMPSDLAGHPSMLGGSGSSGAAPAGSGAAPASSGDSPAGSGAAPAGSAAPVPAGSAAPSPAGSK